MAVYSNMRDYRFAGTNDTEDDIRGSDVYGINDEKLGTIEDVIFDLNSGELRYLVIDAGGWLTTKKFVVPARQLMIREEADKDFHVNLTKEQIEKLPEYRENDVESETGWADYEQRHEASWTEWPILHREGSTHIVTPEKVDNAGGGDGIHHESPRRIAHDMPRFGATSSSDQAVGDSGGLIGEVDFEATAPGARKTIKRQIDEPVNKEEGEAGGTQSDCYSEPGNRRLREFQERVRRNREEILRHQRDRAA